MPVSRRTLRRFDLFRSLDDTAIADLLRHVRQVQYPAGALIFKEEEPANCLYLVRSGTVEIVKATPQGNVLLNKMQPPDIFGEMALLDDEPRSAAARAATRVTLLELPKTVFLSLVERYPHVLQNASRVSDSRLRQRDQALMAELLAHNRQLLKLYETSLDISRHLELSKALAAIVERAAALLDSPAGQLHLYDGEKKLLVPQLTLPPPIAGRGNVSPGVGAIGKAFASGEPVMRNQASLRSNSSLALAAPVCLDSQPVGALSVYRPADQAPFTPDDAQLLLLFANQAAVAIENARLYGLAIDKGRMDGELEAARQVQASLIPAHAPRIAGFRLSGFWRPAREVSGDFYDFFSLAGGRWGIVIADVSDKGMPAALFMAETRSVLRACAEADPDPRTALERANRLLCSDSMGGMFVTLFFAVLEPRARRLTYVNAGHNPPLGWHHRTGQLEELSPHSIALGIDPDAHYVANSLSLEEGDLIVLNTDGVTDAMNEQGEFFGQERLVHVVQTSAPRGDVRAVVQTLAHAVDEFIGQEPLLDDLTVVALAAARQC